MIFFQSQIGKKIITLQIVFSLFFVMAGSVIYFIISYKNQETEFKNDHKTVFRFAEEGLNESLWAFDNTGIESILKGMLQSKTIKKVKIITADNEEISMGEVSEDTIHSELTLSYTYRDEKIILGKVIVYSEKADLIKAIVKQVSSSLIVILFFVLFFLILLYWNLHIILFQDLKSYTDFLKNLKIKRTFTPFMREKKIFGKAADELDQTFNAFNELMANNIRNIKELEEKKAELISLNNSLEDKVQEKTEELEVKLEELERANEHSEELMKELEKAATAEKKANNAKSQFLASMSHEIRTPMGAILGMSDMVLEMDIPAKERDYVQKIHDSAHQLLDVINDILDLSKIESGKIDIETAPFNLMSLLKKLIDVAVFKAEEKKIELKTIIEIEPSTMLLGDSTRLYQILLNLISNAVKFTDTGWVSLHVTAANMTEELVSVRFTVKDTGIGIPSEHLEGIFRPYEQANNKIYSRYGGTGLGLTITKSLIELMGGTLSLQSIVRKGSEFQIEIPFEILTEDKYQQYSPEEDKVALDEIRSNIEGSAVLVAEDNRINQEMIKSFLGKVGIDPIFADNGQEALDKIAENNYELILMDVQMPVLDGISTTMKLRENKNYNHIPIIALTASAMNEEKEKCMNAGMNDFLTKPLNIDTFHQKLNRWLKSRNENKE